MKSTRILVLATGLLGVSIVLGGLKAAFFEPLPFRDPENLVTIGGVAHPDQADYIARFEGRISLEGVTQLQHGRATLSHYGASRRVDVVLVDHKALDLLGLEVVRGRGLTLADRHAPEVALVRAGFLDRTLSGGPLDADLALDINGRKYTVIGIAPEALSRLGSFDLVLPRPIGRTGVRLGQAEASFASTLGRKRRGVSLLEVQADMERLQRSQERPGMGASQVTVAALTERLVRPSLPTLELLSFAALVLLLLAATTVAMLAAMQSSERLNEFAVRSALGASRQRLRQEALRPWLKSVFAATALALLLSGPLSQWIWSTLPSLGPVTPWSVEAILTTLGLGVLLTVAAAAGTLVPHEILNRQLSAGFANANPQGERLGRLLTSVQVTLSVGLFCAAGVAVDALWRQSTRDLGIGPAEVLQINVHLGEETPKETAASAWQRVSSETLKGGVTQASSAWASGLPWTATGMWWVASDRNVKGHLATFTFVGPEFFRTLGIRFLEGSDVFTNGSPADEAVFSESLAKSLGVSVGSMAQINRGSVRVAGIVNDVYDPALKPQARAFQMYLAPGFESQAPTSASIFVRGSPKQALQLRSTLEAALPWASFGPPTPLKALLVKRLERERLGAILLSVYGALAVFLIVVGLGGAMRRRVTQRLREVGIRLSLGASIRQIDEALLRPIAGPALLGVVLGVALGHQVSLALAGLMSWARPLETAVYVGSAMAGTMIVLLVSWPALRAAGRVRPADLLRHL